MRTLVLLSLLLLGTLQAAIAPATSPGRPDGLLQFTDSPYECPPAPAENSTAVRRLADGPRQSALQGGWKSEKIVLAAALSLPPAGDPASSRTGLAGQADGESIQLRPKKPRAPPAAPPV